MIGRRGDASLEMFQEIEREFAAAGRTPKGRKALRDIFQATLRTVAEEGLQASSLDLIAARADLSQAALRHYFHTREELLTAFFVAGTTWFRARLTEILAAPGRTPRATLEGCLSWHLEYIEQVDTVFWLESSAYWLRQNRQRRTRDEWYRWLMDQYSTLIGQIRPALGSRERERKAHAILSLVLGAWVTHGRGSSIGLKSGQEQRQNLVDAAMDIATS
jgi:AcrR family transcriptional regulator